MKRIYLISLNGYTNYGNVYQKYAVKRIYQNLGYKAISIRIEQSIFKYLLRPIYDFLHLLHNKRYRMFYLFSLRHGFNKGFWVKIAKFHKNDLFSTGSDQVWNPFIDPNNRSIYFLRFVSKEQRVCISPSFGVKEIDKKFANEIAEGINGFKYLSVREKDGAEIIHALTGRNAKVLIDPTMMLNKTEWGNLFAPIKHQKKSYILLAMLGNLEEDKKNYLQHISDNSSLRIVNVFSCETIFTPEEVLSLIANAALVFTDSFHFSAFSINFNTPFIVTKRVDNDVDSNMYSRITSLLSLFKMENRAYESITDENTFTCEFNQANKVLQMEREKFDRYIRMALKAAEDAL